MNNKITHTDIKSFEEFLINENKSRTTLDKYMRDIRRFQIFLSDNCYPISQDTADKYIEILKNAEERNYLLQSRKALLVLLRID